MLFRSDGVVDDLDARDIDGLVDNGGVVHHDRGWPDGLEETASQDGSSNTTHDLSDPIFAAARSPLLMRIRGDTDRSHVAVAAKASG